MSEKLMHGKDATKLAIAKFRRLTGYGQFRYDGVAISRDDFVRVVIRDTVRSIGRAKSLTGGPGTSSGLVLDVGRVASSKGDVWSAKLASANNVDKWATGVGETPESAISNLELSAWGEERVRAYNNPPVDVDDTENEHESNDMQRTPLRNKFIIEASMGEARGTVGFFLTILAGGLTQYDADQKNKNAYRLGHYLAGVNNARDELATMLERDDESAMAALKKELVREFSFERGKFELPPINKLVKQIDAWLQDGTAPKYGK